jgi:hypothetical protein
MTGEAKNEVERHVKRQKGKSRHRYKMNICGKMEKNGEITVERQVPPDENVKHDDNDLNIC